MHEGQKLDTLFEIEGPGMDGCVWICSAEPTESAGWWCHKLGPADKVAQVLSRWLASVDEAESSFQLTADE